MNEQRLSADRRGLGGGPAIHGTADNERRAAAVVMRQDSRSAAVCQDARLPIYGPGGRVVGVIVAGELTKTIDGSRHFLKNPPAIALDAGAVAQAEALGVTQICVTDRESDRIYRTTLADLHAHGWEFDRGFGLQIAMRLVRWCVDGAPTSVVQAPEPAIYPVQLGLW